MKVPKIKSILQILKVFLIVIAVIWAAATLNQRIQDYQYEQMLTENISKLIITSDDLSGFPYPSYQFGDARGALPSNSTPIS